MKKFLKVFSFILVIVLLTGCSFSFNLGKTLKKAQEELEEKEKEKEKDKDKEDEDDEEVEKTSDKATCYRHKDDYTESYYMIAKNNKINKVNFTMVYDDENTIADFSTYSKEQKTVFIDAMYENLGVEKTQEGIDVDIKITDTLEVYINADLDKADPDKLESLGFYFDSVNRKLDKAVNNFKTSGYICTYN